MAAGAGPSEHASSPLGGSPRAVTAPPTDNLNLKARVNNTPSPNSWEGMPASFVRHRYIKKKKKKKLGQALSYPAHSFAIFKANVLRGFCWLLANFGAPYGFDHSA